MAKTQILWTTLPYGFVENKRRVSVVVSPRLTPDTANEQKLGAFAEFLNWPQTLTGAQFTALIGGRQVPLRLITKTDSALWCEIFTANTPVEGFVFKDMSRVNLRSYSVRNILGFVKRHYGTLALQSGLELPKLLPWRNADPSIKQMLEEAGTNNRKSSFGFDRFFDEKFESDLTQRAFGSSGGKSDLTHRTFVTSGGIQEMIPSPFSEANGFPQVVNTGKPLRVMSPEWDATQMNEFRTAHEYDLYQADRFYRRRRPTPAELAMRRPDFRNIPDPPKEPIYDFHRMVAALSNYPELMRRLGLVLDFVFDETGVVQRPAVGRTLLGRDSATTSQSGREEGRIKVKIDWNNGHNPASDVTPWTAYLVEAGRFITRPRSSSDYVGGLLNLQNADDRYQVEINIDSALTMQVSADRSTVRQVPQERMPIEKGLDRIVFDDTESSALSAAGSGRSTNLSTAKAVRKKLFDIYQVDPDGAALKTVDFTLSSQNLINKQNSQNQLFGEVTYTTGDQQGVASLRSGGLGVSRHGRAVDVAINAAAAALKNEALASGSGNNITLFAEDVHRGYRVDVCPVRDRQSFGKWYSLCARVGEYRLIKNNQIIELKPDEGYVSGPSTTSGGTQSENPDDHYLHESLFRWNGWSLCTTRPGLALVAEEKSGSHMQSEEARLVTDTAQNGCGVSATFTTKKGSLPRLRFGQLYRLRARIVDLAGNSLAIDDPSLEESAGASEAVGYWRFEPIDPPVMVHRSRVSEGESLERMVIRSNYDVSTEGYLQTQPFKNAITLPASRDFSYSPQNERHFVPPKSSQQQCETHGLFDEFFGSPELIKKGYELAARDEKTLNDALPGSKIEFVTPSSLNGVATTVGKAPSLPSDANPLGDRMAGGQYVIHREAQIITPWLPDGASEGTALRALSGYKLPGVTVAKSLGNSCNIKTLPSGDFVILVKHGGRWPNLDGFRLILAEPPSLTQPKEPVWKENERTLTFFLPKGNMARLLYGSYANERLVDSFGIPQWTGNETNRRSVCKSALLGANWLIAPFRELTLVHATQAPVREPIFEMPLSIARGDGAQYVQLNNRVINLHSPSTGKFELEAQWSEWVDDINQDSPKRVDYQGQLGEIKIPENYPETFTLQHVVNDQVAVSGAQQQRGDTHHLGDTRFRLIKYRMRATTRFREYLPPSVYADKEKTTRVGLFSTGTSLAVPPQDDAGAPILYDPNGSTQHTAVWASAPPTEPRVLYVVPTMLWSRNLNEQHNVTRYGNGLRVWLDRPWFSSGDGEMLGVIIPENEGLFSNIPHDMQSLVSQWGADPFWESPAPKSKASNGDFPEQVYSERVTLQEKPDTYVTVVGHRVHWDGGRGLWYCDIVLNPGAMTYMPFIRLALVRYQLHALPSAKISKVVTADFAQVLPHRRAVVQIVGNNVTAALHGPNPAAGPMKRDSANMVGSAQYNAGSASGDIGRNRVELVLQTRDPQIESDLAWEDTALLVSQVIGAATQDGTYALNNIMPTIKDTSVLKTAIKSTGKASTNVGNTKVEVLSRAGSAVRLEPVFDLGELKLKPGYLATLVDAISDSPFWSAMVTMPPAGIRPRRLMIREFERFYSDNVLLDKSTMVAASNKRVVEERLVFADIIRLDKESELT